MVAPGGCAWLLQGGMHGCSRGGHAWLLQWGGMCGCSWGVHGCSRGHAWLLPGGVCGCSGGACVVALGGVRGCFGGHGFFDEIRSMSGWYASYWNAFLLKYDFQVVSNINMRNY